MTNEDAKTIMDNLIYLYRPLGNSLKAWHMAIEALEKADKYRWHDLRKNPDDLPEADEYGCSEYVLVMTGTPEWDNHEWAYYNHNTRVWSTPFCEQNVFAWRYIEPFKGGRMILEEIERIIVETKEGEKIATIINDDEMDDPIIVADGYTVRIKPKTN